LIIDRLNTGRFTRRNVVLDVALQLGDSS